jgi:hypothetical protein
MGRTKYVPLTDILTEEQIEVVMDHIKNETYPQLKEYLNGLESQLTEKGVVPDYLYYVLMYKFKNGDE